VTASNDSPRALIRYALAGLALTAALSWIIYLVRDVLVLIYIAALVAIGLGPIVNAIERNRWPRTRFATRVPRWVAILTIYLAMIGAIVGVGMLVLPPLVAQARELWSNLPDLLHRGQMWLIERGFLNRELSVQEAVQRTPVGGADAVDTVIGAVSGFVGGIFGFVTILILAFYMMLDAESFARTFVRLFPPSDRPRAAAAARSVSAKVSAWLGGQLLLASVIGSTAAIGLYVMGVPYFYVLALIAAFGELIPIVGPVLSAVPAVIVALTVSPTLALGVIVFFLVQQQFENHIHVPKVMQRQVGVSPVTVITSLLIGGSLLGVVGAILAIPTAAILQVAFYELWPDAADT
jgi:predicted PurR-regulated permease PerM